MTSNHFRNVVPVIMAAAVFCWTGIIVACAGSASTAISPVETPILNQWQGDFPVSQLLLLPEPMRNSNVGYLDNSEVFAAVWMACELSHYPAQVDFSRNLVVYARNVEFYNRIRIAKIMVRDGVAEIIAMETLSAAPIVEKAAIALVEIPRKGIEALQTRDGQIALP